jgi:hypothetical protein
MKTPEMGMPIGELELSIQYILGELKNYLSYYCKATKSPFEPWAWWGG